MPRGIQMREPEDWPLELRRLQRIRLAAELEPLRSERWKRMIAACTDAVALLIVTSPEGEGDAIRLARGRLAEELREEGVTPPGAT